MEGKFCFSHYFSCENCHLFALLPLFIDQTVRPIICYFSHIKVERNERQITTKFTIYGYSGTSELDQILVN